MHWYQGNCWYLQSIKVYNIIEEIILCSKRLNVYYFVWRQAAEHSAVLNHKHKSNIKGKTREDNRNTIFWSVQALHHPFHKDKYKISLSGLLVNWKYLSQNKAGLHHLTQAHVVVITQWTQTDAGWKKKEIYGRVINEDPIITVLF
jgi:hypothetical protein